MPTLSPEILNFLKFFLSAPNRFDVGQQTTDVQGAPGIAGGEQAPGTQPFDSFFQQLSSTLGGLGGGATPGQSGFSKFKFFS